jgi:hypothetical protein
MVTASIIGYFEKIPSMVFFLYGDLEGQPGGTAHFSLDGVTLSLVCGASLHYAGTFTKENPIR